MAWAWSWVRRLVTDGRARLVLFTKISLPVSVLTGGWKLVLAVPYESLLLAITGLYAITLSVIRSIALRTYLRDETHNRRTIGVAVIVLSLAYAITCIPMVVGTESWTKNYTEVAGIAIATITFTEIGLAVNGAIRNRHHPAPMVAALQLSNLAGALIVLPVTQAAILSFTHPDDPSQAAGVTGILCGVAAAGLGLRILTSRDPAQPTSSDGQAQQARFPS